MYCAKKEDVFFVRQTVSRSSGVLVKRINSPALKGAFSSVCHRITVPCRVY